MMTSQRLLLGATLMILMLFCIASCGPSSDAAVEQVAKYGVNMHSEAYKALTPAQQAEALRLAKERNLPVIGDGERYGPGHVFSKTKTSASSAR
jgi:hypothetical protein